jgi:DNA-binding beta-propeller fold protein YncE
MKSRRNSILKFYGILVITFVCLVSHRLAASQDNYTFERAFPVLEQPWYFYYPYSLVSDKDDFIYISDTRNDRIQKFTRDGQFVTKWGVKGNKEGEFFLPSGLAIDNKLGFIYVSDSGNHRIQKFTLNGQFEAAWGTKGTGAREFDYPYGLAADQSGFVYVADMNNHRIQKFKSDGAFVSQWGSKGVGNGQFDAPQGIASDSSGFIYVSDMNNDRVQKFTSEGVFVSQWGTEGSGDGEFYNPEGIAVDYKGFVYVTDVFNHRIQKFTDQGQFVMKWGVKGTRDGEFNDPDGMTFDSSGFIYVADAGNSRIQKFTSDGIFVSRWGSNSGQGEFNLPYGIGIDRNSFIYVADTGNHRIQKFSSEGEFLIEWGTNGIKPGQFISPYDVAADKDNFIFVADSGNHRIQKFSSDGQFVTEWGKRGSEPGQFILPYGIAIDKDGFILVTDAGNDRVQKFTSDGVFVSQWGGKGSEPGQFMYPYRLAVDNKGFVYVADTGNKRIQKFDSDGNIVPEWRDLEFDSPNSVTLDSDGFVLVAETGKHRIRKFTPEGEFISQWGELGTYPGQMNYPCDLAADTDGRVYVADTYNHRIQIFKKISVQINNKALIVAGGGPYPGNHLWSATEMNANFAYRTLIYQGFGKENIEYLSSDTELDLDNNGKADDVDGKPTADNFRNIIRKWKTSVTDSLVVYLVDHGSEGSFFMDGETSSSLSVSDLNQWLKEFQSRVPAKVIIVYDACKSGSFVSALGSDKQRRMVITSTSDTENAHFLNQGTLSFSNFFWTDIFNGHSVNEAFDRAKQAIANVIKIQNPVLDSNISEEIHIGCGTAIPGDAPVIESISQDQTLSDGTSSAQIVAEGVTDNDGIAGVRAVIMPPDYTGSVSDSTVLELPFVNLMPAGENRYEGSYDGFNIKGAYRIAVYAKDGKGNTAAPKLTSVSVGKPVRRKAVLIAGSSESDVLWPCVRENIFRAYSALTFQGYTDEDIQFMSPSASSEGINRLPTLKNLHDAIETWAADSARDLVIYFIGNSRDKSLYLNNAETLTGAKLKLWLDTLQAKMPGMVTVICDTDNSGAFLPLLATNEGAQRILISGASDHQPAVFLSGGDISFSAFFWNHVLNGENIRDAFQKAAQDIVVFSDSSPLLDDNGNGVGNEAEDGMISAGYTLGFGIRMVPSQSVSTDTDIPIPCEPDDRPDPYEPDDEAEQAKVIFIDDIPQCHNFHRAGDADTVLFYGLSGKFYTVETDCQNCKIVTEVFDAGGNLSASCDTRFWDWKCPQEGFYTLRIRPADTSFFGKETAYLLKLYQPVGPNSGDLTGIVSDAVSGRPVDRAVIKSNGDQSGVSLPNGKYIIFHEPGTFTVTVESPGYNTAIYENITIPEGGSKSLNAALVPEVIGMSQLLRVIQLYSSGGYHCDASTEDGYGPGQGDKNCTPHCLDSAPQDWQVGLNELLRLIQMSNISGENAKTGGFAP